MTESGYNERSEHQRRIWEAVEKVARDVLPTVFGRHIKEFVRVELSTLDDGYPEIVVVVKDNPEIYQRRWPSTEVSMHAVPYRYVREEEVGMPSKKMTEEEFKEANRAEVTRLKEAYSDWFTGKVQATHVEVVENPAIKAGFFIRAYVPDDEATQHYTRYHSTKLFAERGEPRRRDIVYPIRLVIGEKPPDAEEEPRPGQEDPFVKAVRLKDEKADAYMTFPGVMGIGVGGGSDQESVHIRIYVDTEANQQTLDRIAAFREIEGIPVRTVLIGGVVAQGSK